MIERVADWRRAAIESDASEGRVGSRGDREDDEPRDSWVDAFVTLLAIVVFGLGWALVELEGADRAANRYVPAVSEMRVAGLEPELGGEPFWSDDWAVGGRADRAESPFEEASWTARAPQNSNR